MYVRSRDIGDLGKRNGRFRWEWQRAFGDAARTGGITAGELLVGMVIANAADGHGRPVKLSRAFLGGCRRDDPGDGTMRPRTVTRHVSGLVAKGWLTRRHRFARVAGGRMVGRANEFALQLPAGIEPRTPARRQPAQQPATPKRLRRPKLLNETEDLPVDPGHELRAAAWRAWLDRHTLDDAQRLAVEVGLPAPLLKAITGPIARNALVAMLAERGPPPLSGAEPDLTSRSHRRD